MSNSIQMHPGAPKDGPGAGADLIGELIDVAERMAAAAGAAIEPWFRAPRLAVDDKADTGFDPVTAADRAAEAAMRAVLAEHRPRDAILGEEAPPKAGDSGIEWVLDPIDGTRGFICGAPTWGVLIAANRAGAPFLGLIEQPYIGERFLGVTSGDGPFAELRRTGAAPHPLRTRPCARLADATLMTTFPEIGTPEERAGFERVRDAVRLTRYGTDCYAYALLAHGCIDLVIEAGLQPYDVQALVPVVEAAGGRITDWRGGSCAMGGRVLAAGDPALHAAALEMLADPA